MEDYNFYQVQGWMVNNLNLKGNELICYAVIYSFSQDEESKFMGGVKYLCGWLNASEPTVISVLEKLVAKGLIEPIPVITKTCKRVYYQVTKDSLVRGNLRNLSKGTKDSLGTLYNNNNNNIDNNKKPTKVGKKSVAPISKEEEEKDKQFEAYMKDNYPYLMKMDKPLTRQEAKKLKELYGEEVVLDVFNAMNNHKRLLRDYRSAYQTANNWCTRRIQNEAK